MAEIRLRGLMGGIEVVKGKATGERYPYEYKVGYKVCAEGRRRGVLPRPLGNVIVLMPPLAIQKRDLARLVEVITRSIERTTKRISRGEM